MSDPKRLWLIAGAGGVVYALAWFSAAESVEWLAADSPARAAYGSICAWWFALFVSYVLDLNWRAGFSAIILHFPLSMISPHPKSVLTEMSLADLARLDVLLLLAAVILLFLSPLLLGMAVRLIKTKLLQHLEANA